MPMPLPSDAPSLRRLTETSAPASGRFLADESQLFELQSLAGRTRFAAARKALHGATVLLRTETQLTTALALLELDGLARRIVLCTPDLSQEHLRLAAGMAEATVIVADRPVPDLTNSGLVRIAPDAIPTPLAAEPKEYVATEWALFTSGTSGPPKLALHRLATLIGAIDRTKRPTPGRVWSTFYDIRRYGGLQILLRALIGGGSIVLSGADEPTAFLQRAAAACVDFLSGTPTHWRRALLSPASAAICPSDVRLSGEVADQAILDKLRTAYPAARICHAFASTEAGVAFDVCDGLAGFPAEWVDRAGPVELRVVDGTLRIRSGRRAECYLGAGAGPLADAEGFVDTRDLVVRRGDRYHFAGRSDGVINVGGLKVNPIEIEDVINHHPRVAMSLVRARRSPIIGQIVLVEIMLREATPSDSVKAALETEIMEFCRRSLPAYKVPAMVRIVPSLAITAAGKLIRPAA